MVNEEGTLAPYCDMSLRVSLTLAFMVSHSVSVLVVEEVSMSFTGSIALNFRYLIQSLGRGDVKG